MDKAVKVEISKCYLVQILDSDGNELDSDYVFCSRDEAKEIGRQMKQDYNEERETL